MKSKSLPLLLGSLVRNCEKLELSTGLTQEEQIYKLPCGADGDEVLFHKNSQRIKMAEVLILDLMGKVAKMTNAYCRSKNYCRKI